MNVEVVLSANFRREAKVPNSVSEFLISCDATNMIYNPGTDIAVYYPGYY